MATQYVDPASERLGNGRSMSELMRPGLRGVVIAKATPGGLPSNYDPHDRSHIEIHVEPDSANSTLTLDRLTKSAVDSALAAAKKQVQGGDIDAIRERAAVAFEQLAKMPKSGVVARPAKQASAAPARSLAEDLQPHAESDREEAAALNDLREEAAALAAMPTALPIDKIDRGYSPMAAFGLKKAPMTANAGEPHFVATANVPPPQKLVYFEKEGIGTVPAFFHDVLVNVARPEPDSPEETGFIVLVYDVRFAQSAARWFPPSNDPYGRPWAAKISDDNRLYLVHTTGFQYIYDSREYCVLHVEKAIWAAAGGE